METVTNNIIEPGRRLLSDKAWARWTALALVASMMLFAYMFVDVMSPLQSLIQTQRGWSPDAFGYYAGAEYILNVFGFLILAGIILDKMGVRFTGTLSASLMVIGACIKLYGISELPGYSSRAMAQLMVGSHARQRQTRRSRIYDLRMRLRDGRYHCIKSPCQMV